MKRLMTTLMALGAAWTVSAETILLECEQFKDLGGWSIDSQFIDEMGSSYLLAHGLGKPVADAKTTFEVKKAGRYNVYVRTKNWVYKWLPQGRGRADGAGAFKLSVNGVKLPNLLGWQGKGEWLWVKADDVTLKAGANTVAICDVNGFDGRCDAICFSTDSSDDVDPAGRPCLNWLDIRPFSMIACSGCTYDLCVVGGGIAGICTAISAARLGLKVALVQDRPVLGGANSSEVRVHLGGYQNLGPYPRLGDVVAEIGPKAGGNAQPAERYEDDRKLAAVKAEKNIDLFLNQRVTSVFTNEQGRIDAVGAVHTRDGVHRRFAARLFADCTGDGTVGYLAGADYRLGRESKAMTGEKDAVDVADRQILGASCQWYAERKKVKVIGEGGEGAKALTAEPLNRLTFPNEPWMIKFNEEAVDYALRGDWNWETGMNRDQLKDFETVRDYAMLVAYSNWNHVKNIGPRKAEFADAELTWLAYVAGKRETRRLMGDHILTYDDVFEERKYPDGTCCTTWAIDLHYPMPANQRNYDGEPFRSICTHDMHYPYPIPYRCFYSRNVPNLFMAGRDISVTHVALGTTRVMRTHGMMGEVVGMAASICKKRGCDPRGVYEKHLDELKALMTKGVGLGRPQPPQNYNCGACKFRKPTDNPHYKGGK